jgi:phosphate transport system protein
LPRLISTSPHRFCGTAIQLEQIAECSTPPGVESGQVSVQRLGRSPAIPSGKRVVNPPFEDGGAGRDGVTVLACGRSSITLAALRAQLVTMSTLTATAITRATRALLEADLALAETVISEDDEIGERGRRCETHACTLLARQTPVARDLRVVVTAIKAGERIERMGDLARHIAEITRLRHPHPVLPADLTSEFALMGQLAAQTAHRVMDTLFAPTGDCHSAQERTDDEIDRLHHVVLERICEADPAYPVQVGVDVALLARYYERFADQAVTVSKQLDYMVTGHKPT